MSFRASENCQEQKKGRHAPERSVGPSCLTNEATPAILILDCSLESAVWNLLICDLFDSIVCRELLAFIQSSCTPSCPGCHSLQLVFTKIPQIVLEQGVTSF